MESSSSTSSFSWPSWGGAISVGIVLSSLFWADPWLRDVTRTHSTNETVMLVEHHRASIERGGPSAEILLLGDSSLRSSVVPSILAEATGQTVENLGLVIAGGTMSDYSLLKAYLQHKTGRPKTVVLMHTLALEVQSADSHLYQVYFPNFLTTVAMYRAQLLDPQQLMDTTLRGVIRTYGYKEYVRPVMERLVFEGWDAFARDGETNAAFRRARTEQGYFPHHGVFDPEKRPVQVRAPGSETFRMSPKNAFFLEQLLILAREENLSVVFAHGPLWDREVENRTQSGYVASLNGALAAYQSAGLTVLYPDIPAFAAEALAPQNNHLNERGARRFSRWLGEALSGTK